MRFRFLFLLIGLTAILLGACSGTNDTQITPAADKLTFLFFYTEGWVPWTNMEPVVNGLEEEFEADVEFRWIDAISTDGQKIFRSFSLRGHPSYVILNPEADVLWLGFGEQSRDIFIEQIRLALGE